MKELQYKFEDIMSRTPDELKLVAFYVTVFSTVAFRIGLWLCR